MQRSRLRRIQMGLDLVKNHLDSLAKAINYYPVRPASE